MTRRALRALALLDQLPDLVARRIGPGWHGPIELAGQRFGFLADDGSMSLVCQPHDAEDGTTWLLVHVLNAAAPGEAHILAGEIFGPHVRVYELTSFAADGPQPVMIWGQLQGCSP